MLGDGPVDRGHASDVDDDELRPIRLDGAEQLLAELPRPLRVQATDARLKRQAAAEEKAAKSPIKMLFPTVIFIFPAMFIVILGPAMLNLMTIF